MASSSQPQQINVSDLDIQQLADVRKQLEEVYCRLHLPTDLLNAFAGAKSPDQFLRPAQAGPVKIQVLSREYWRGQTQELEYV